jgi:hypothetical protein
VDESEYRRTRGQSLEHACAFEPALQACGCRCSLAAPRHLAEREAIGCREAPAAQTCALLREVLTRGSAFALKQPARTGLITHAQHLKVQCGGLRGLALALGQGTQVDDIAWLVRKAQARYGGLEALPLSEIVRSVAAFALRHRPRRDRPDA